ncbi:MAG TPA: polysaccharide deacetylase family protein [Ilumatobacteraceae bacterium]|nr:polysaccharide deacetylase family protein [Ilumatobacteraceae bacterium]
MRRARNVARSAAAAWERMRPGRFGVLAFHRVDTSCHDPWGLAVSPQHFDEQLIALHEIGTIVPLDRALEISVASRFRSLRPQFAMTFDDGYVDNLRHAVELLERHDATATVFVATGYLDRPSFWWDVFASFVLESRATPAGLVRTAERIGLITAAQAAETVGCDRLVVHDQLYEALVRRPNEEILAILDEMADDAGVVLPTPVQRPLTTAELVELASHPLVTIGAHTASHPRLTCLTPEERRAEILEGDQRLNELIGRQSRVFAYPYGNTDAAVTDVVRQCGFRYAVTTEPRWVGLREDPLLLPRLPVPDLDDASFRDWLWRSG